MTGDVAEFETKLERSSLGTPSAQAARASVSDVIASGIVAKAAADVLERGDGFHTFDELVEGLPAVEVVAEAVHEAWMEAKRALGVTSRPSEWGEEQMVPYADLSERAKDLDRATVRSVYAAIGATIVATRLAMTAPSTAT